MDTPHSSADEHDTHAEIQREQDEFVHIQNQINGLNAQIKQLKKQQNPVKKKIIEYMRSNGICTLMVDEFVFQQGTKEKFSCTEKQFDELLPNVDKEEFMKTVKYGTVKTK